MRTSKEQNRLLCEKYPFLIPRNRWSGKRITEAVGGGYWPGNKEAVPEYDYEFTELDEMPDGWRIAFGEQLCEELADELKRHDCLDTYTITQIKEKYGILHWYDAGNTKRGYEIIGKYARRSRETCICCGKPATRVTTGWISPFCDECVGDEDSVPIREWFNEFEDDE